MFPLLHAVWDTLEEAFTLNVVAKGLCRPEGQRENSPSRAIMGESETCIDYYIRADSFNGRNEGFIFG